MPKHKMSVCVSGCGEIIEEADSRAQAIQNLEKGGFDTFCIEKYDIDSIEVIEELDEEGEHIITNTDREADGQLVLLT